jgi:predicted site-specific integrase-resolvase
MTNRKDYFKMLNLINERYNELVIELHRKNATKAHFERLRAIRRQHEESLKNIYSDDLVKLNDGQSIVFRKVG